MFRAAASLALALALSLAPDAALASSGEITHLSGAVIARSADGQTRILSVKSAVAEGDLLLTAENSFARVKFTDGSEVVLRPGTQLKIDSYRFEERNPADDGFVVSLLKGGIRSITGLLARRNPAKASYATPTATIGVRGTHFGALFCNNDCAGVPGPRGGAPANGLHVDVADGRIVVSTPAGAREFSVGQYGYVESARSVPVLVPPNRGIRVQMPADAARRDAPGKGVGKAGGLECVI